MSIDVIPDTFNLLSPPLAREIDEVLGGLPSKQYTQGSRVDQHHCC